MTKGKKGDPPDYRSCTKGGSHEWYWTGKDYFCGKCELSVTKAKLKEATDGNV